MKIAICSETEELNGLVPMTFRDAQYLMIIETKGNELQAIYEKEDEGNIAFAEYIVENGCEAVICGAIERAPFDIIVAAGITRYDGSSKKVQKAYTYMLRDKLPLIRDHIGGPGPVGHSHDYSCDCGHGEEEEEDIPDTFDAVISAGGMSSRMGDFKPLMTLGGEVNILRQIRMFRAAGVGKITVVIGHRGDEIRACVENYLGADQDCVNFVENPDYATTQMFESVKLGLRSLEPENHAEHHGIFFVPVDVPLFTAFTLNALMDHFSYDIKDVYIPTCSKEDGHPLLIRSSAVDRILNGDASQGLRSVLAGESISMVRVDVPDRGAILDADTPEEYKVLMEELENRKAPDEKTCRRLLKWAGVEKERRRHGELVAEKAVDMANACLAGGFCNAASLNVRKIYAASLLHDILKGMDQHAERGQEMLTELGMPEIGALVGTHTTLPEEYQQSVNENMILYLADKLVADVRPVSLEERFAEKREGYRFDKKALKGVEKRYQAALACMKLLREAGWQG